MKDSLAGSPWDWKLDVVFIDHNKKNYNALDPGKRPGYAQNPCPQDPFPGHV